jgi:hypothetical protein
VHQGGGARTGSSGAQRWRSPATAKSGSRPRFCAGKTPTCSWGDGELEHVLARVVRAAAAAWRQRGRTAGGRRAAAWCEACGSRKVKGRWGMLPYHTKELRRERGRRGRRRRRGSTPVAGNQGQRRRAQLEQLETLR